MQNMKIIQEGYIDVTKIFEQSNIEFKNISNENLSYTMIEFYTLIAMACLYGGILGMVSVNNNLANMGNVGKRISISPTKKGKIIFSTLLASYLTQLIVLLALVGSLAGLTLGIAVATLVKANENTKTGVLIAVTMLRLFFIRNDGNYYEIYCR